MLSAGEAGRDSGGSAGLAFKVSGVSGAERASSVSEGRARLAAGGVVGGYDVRGVLGGSVGVLSAGGAGVSDT